MRTRRILILCAPGLLAQGLVRLLEAEPRLEVTTVATDGQPVARLIQEIQPDVLLVEEDQFRLMLGDPPESISLDRAPLVISLGHNDNHIHICRIEQRALTALTELYEALAAQENGTER